MSKFSEALNKIQEQREGEGDVEKLKKTASAYANAEEMPGRQPSWDVGIQHVKNNKPDLSIVTYHFPNSLISEQYRMLRTSLKNKIQADGVQVIMVSSSVHSEGKSVTSANLALALAEEEGVRVALIDGDLRRGKMHHYFGLGEGVRGLSNILTEDINPKLAIYRNSKTNFVVIPRGEVPKQPSGLISSQKFRLLIAELRTHYHYIIIDAPPIMSVADPGIMARDTDGVLFIIQVGRTPKSMIAHASQLFKQTGAKVLGYVLTNVEYQSADYKYYRDYYQHYENADKKGIKHHTKLQMKKAGYGIENAESKFNKWWSHKVLKGK